MATSDADDDREAARKHLFLTELFGTHPRALVDSLVVSANEHLYLLGSQLEQHVREHLGDSAEADRDAEQGVHAITTLLEHAIDHTMDTFELYCLRSIFVVTPEQSRRVTMSHHRGLDLRPSASSNHTDADYAPEEISDNTISDAEDRLRRRIACARTTQHRLAQAEAASKVLLERAQAAAKAYAFILNGAKRFAADGEAPSSALINMADEVSSNVYSVMEALDSLRGSDPLRVALSCTHNPSSDSDDTPLDNRREWEKGRDEYLNWEANRILASMKRAGSSA
ncbi:hypothetical protein MCAP1_000686 [Malassezia caprae]|uniref:Uncharacterized protein n=1 Tax=Malassezia caprae TaxID=1381934 RepID=A0AAF0E9C2_9BASI|nr:hypothetical protein MCAP1_000686 [Malassezia caprae]